MFTGIIEEPGKVESVEMRPVGARLRIRCRKVLEDISEGASIAVNGVCLTAVENRADSFGADVSPETLSRSNLGALRQGGLVNLERPVSPAGRLGGHIVQGHIDGTGEFVALEPLGEDNWWLRVRLPEELTRYVVEKGSIAIDGVSLTIAAVDGDEVAATIIPHTYRTTTLGAYQPGGRVNVECDILAKHVERLLEKMRPASRLTMDKLRDLGY